MHVENQYYERYERYDGMPPHDKPSPSQKKRMKEAGETIPELESDSADEGGD